MGCTAERYCLLHIVVQGPGSSEIGQLFSTMYGCGATGRQSCPISGFWPNFLIQNPRNVPSGDQPTAQGLDRRMITIFPCDSRRSKGVPSGSAVFLRLLVGELGTPKLAQSFAYGKWPGAAQRLQRWGVQITASEASRKIFLLYPPKGGTNIILRHPTGGTKSLQKLPVG